MASVRPISQAPVLEYFDADGNSLGTFTQRPQDSTGDNPYTKADDAYSVQTPLTGFSITVGNGVRWLQLTPAGTLATGTITFPVSTSLTDGQELQIGSTQIQTALTLAGNGATIAGALTAGAAANWFAHYKYALANNTWYRIG